MYFRIHHRDYLRGDSVVAMVRDSHDPVGSTRIYQRRGDPLLVKMRIGTLCRHWQKGKGE